MLELMKSKLLKNLFLAFLFLTIIPSLAFAFSMQTGNYVGNGASRSITGVGFEPDLVIIKSDRTGYAVWRSSSMDGDSTAYFYYTANQSGCIASLDSDGFSLGTSSHVNSATIRYNWIAFSGSGGSDFYVGSYTGDGTDDRNITGIGFQPDLVWVKGNLSARGMWTTSSMATDSSHDFHTRAPQSNRIQELQSDGSQVGSNSEVNQSGNTYYYVAFKEEASSMAVGSYTGDGVDDTEITGVGFSPDFVFIDSDGGTDGPVLRNDQTHGDEGQYFMNYNNDMDLVQSLEDDGFKVGTDSRVNTNADTYYYAAFAGATAPTPSGTFNMVSGSYVGNSTSQSITGVGFEPDLVLIKSDSNNRYACFSHSGMSTSYTGYLAYAGTTFTTGITSFDEDGFTVANLSHVNYLAQTFRYIAFENAGSTNFAVGAYTGTGVGGDDRSITGVGFQPDLVVIKGHNAQLGVFRTSSMAGDATAYFSGTADTTDCIQALESDGFQIGEDDKVNEETKIFYYFAFKDTAEQFDVGTYVGDGNDPHDITGLGFRPGLVWIKEDSTDVAYQRPASLTGSTQSLEKGANADDLIQALDADGFELGGSTGVNETGVTYRYAAWETTSTALAYTVEPSNATAGDAIAPSVKVAVQDANENTDTTDDSTEVTIAIGTNPGSGTLSGTLTQTAASGIATFDDLNIDKAGTGYTLVASATDMSDATSATFNITPDTANYLVITGESTMTSGDNQTIYITAYDEHDNIATGYDGDKTLTFSGANASPNPATNPSCQNKSSTDIDFGSDTVVTFSNGAATSVMKLYKAESASIDVTDGTIETSNTNDLDVVVSTGTKSKLLWSTQPTSPVIAGATWAAFAIEITDAYGNRTTDTDDVTVTPSSASFTGTITQAAVSGLATFDDIVYFNTATPITVSGSADGLTGTGASGNITINLSAADHFVITGSGAMDSGGSQTITITAYDADGLVALVYDGDKILTFSGANASASPATNPSCRNKDATDVDFGSDTVVTFSEGVATSLMKLYKAESISVDVTDGSINTSNTDDLDVTVSTGTKNKLLWSTQPTSPVTAGATWAAFAIEITDAYGNRTTDTDDVTVTPSSASFTGTITQAAVSGLATFDDIVYFNTATPITVSGSADGLTGTGASGNITINLSAADHFVITGSGAMDSGGSQTITITAYDADGLVALVYDGDKILTFSGANASASPATNPSCRNKDATDVDFGSDTVVTFSEGVATSLMKLYKAESISVDVTDGSINTSNTDDLDVTVSTGTKNKLLWSTQPTSPVTAGATWAAFAIEITDAYGNRTTDTDDVTVTPSSASFTGTITQAAVSGLATFNDIEYFNAATPITVFGSASGLTGTGASGSVTINLSAADHFVITGNSAMDAGDSQTVTITAYDANGLVALVYDGDKTLTFSGANASASPATNPSCRNKDAADIDFASDTVVTFTEGVATSLMKLYKAENVSIEATQGTLETTSGNQLQVDVSADSKSKLLWVDVPSSSVFSGVTWDAFSIEITDAYGNRTSDTDNVTVNPSAASFNGTKTKAAVSGIAAFTDISFLNTAESITVVGTSAGVTDTTTIASISINFAPMSYFGLSGTAAMTAGDGQTVTVTAYDANGSQALLYSGDKTLTFSGANASASPETSPSCRNKDATDVAFGSDTIVTFSEGVATSLMKLYKAEITTVEVTQGTYETSSDMVLTVDVSAGTNNKLLWVTQPNASVLAGQTWESFSVEMTDVYGNRVNDAAYVYVSPSAGDFEGSLSGVAFSGIVAFNNLTCNSVQDLTLSATSEGLITTEVSNTVSVGFGTKYQLGLITQPSTTEINSVITSSIEVAVQNQYGITITDDSSSEVTFAILNNPSEGILAGTLTQSASSGIASFADLSIDKYGTGYTLMASSEGLLPVVSNAFDITAAPGTKLVFSVQPSNALAGSVITPEVVVQIQDQFDNIITTDSNTSVTVSLLENAAGGALFGTTTQTASSGVITFDDLYVNTSGESYTLEAAAAGLATATAESFDIAGLMIRPVVLSVSPSRDAENVLTSSEVIAAFSQNMDTDSVETAFILKAILDNNNSAVDIEITGTTTWDALDRIFTFSPSGLTKGYTYLASFETTARNADLISLASVESWAFTTVYDHTQENKLISDDGDAKVDLGTETLPDDGYVEINREPRTAPVAVDADKITSAINKVLAEGNPLHYPIESTITEFVLFDSEGTEVATRFAESAVLTLYYDDEDSDGIVDGTDPEINEENLLLYRLDETNSLWVRVPNSTVNATANYVYAPVNSFSVYTLMSTAALTLTNSYSFPNPYKPSDGHTTITFTNLAAQCTIRIFSLSGELVKTISESDGDGQNSWDVTNEGGEALHSGLYLYVISSTDDVKKGKLVVIR